MSLKHNSKKKYRKQKSTWKADTIEEYIELEQKFKEKYLGKEKEDKGTVRIIAGKAKNTQLDIPQDTRAMTDRMKTRIFDILGGDVKGMRVLDLFAGSGSFGLEALSRGADYAIFIDSSKDAVPILESNIYKCGFTGEAEVYKQKAEVFLQEAVDAQTIFDLVFIDPPYKMFNRKQTSKVEFIINESARLLPGDDADLEKEQFPGVLLVKHPTAYPIENLNLDDVELSESFTFGNNSISMLIWKIIN